MRSLDTYIIEVEVGFGRFLHGDTQHNLRCQFDEVYLKHLAYKREASRSTQVTFNYLDVVSFGKELDIEGSRYVQFVSDLLADAFHASQGFGI